MKTNFGTLEEFAELYLLIIGTESTYLSVKKSYEKWKRFQNWADNTPEELKNSKLVIWKDFPNAKSWIEKEEEKNIYQSKQPKQITSDSWNEVETNGSPVKNEIISAFIKNKQSKKILDDLLVPDINPEKLFPAIKHFCKFIKMPVHVEEDLDLHIVTFIKSNFNYISMLCHGVLGDGERVFRTVSMTCTLFAHYIKHHIKACSKLKAAKMVLHHDDSPCYQRLLNGYCPSCKFHPDMQSTCFHSYCPSCDIELKNMRCEKCGEEFKNE